MEDFKRDYFQKQFRRLTPEERLDFVQSLPAKERRDMLQSLPPDERLAGLSPEQIHQYLERLTTGRPVRPPEGRKRKGS
jgi:hypothetical protein